MDDSGTDVHDGPEPLLSCSGNHNTDARYLLFGDSEVEPASVMSGLVGYVCGRLRGRKGQKYWLPGRVRDEPN